jgi:hypothetical protein
MVEGSCHCGKVRIALDDAPDEATECNCSICRRQGTLWCYSSPKRVHIAETIPTQVYIWGDRMLELHRCTECGCVTHWTPIDRAHDRMGVNIRLFTPDVLAATRRKFCDGASFGGRTF